MIDLRLLRDEPDLVRASLVARSMPATLADELLSADAARRAIVTAADQLRSEQKATSKKIGAASREERPAMLAAAQQLAAQVKALEEEERAAELTMRAAHLAVPNLVEDGVPPGGENDSVVLATVGEVPAYDFVPRDHVAVGTALRALDMERGAKVSGARFYFLTGVGAELEFALANLAMAQARRTGFTPMIAPSLVRPEAMEGTGFLGAHADEVYRLAADELYLVGTSEVALAAYHSDEILDLAAGPIRYAGWSSCFRREAGSYGKDTRGLVRVHWFDKVEMFSFCTPVEAVAEHQRLLDWEQQFLAALELPYQVVDIAAGDLGSSAVRKYDCEAWFPSQSDYRELTSTSNCTTFQARRLNIRYRDEDGRPQVAATLNGTLCAIARTIACLLEVHQQADGSVRVPEALRPYLSGREVLEPVA
ncbi:MAG: serine--tRNA ligase [Geodermatophilaceae bacterium]|nr:serine--tRNA ligase [Geodermatophilaceae bacterium]